MDHALQYKLCRLCLCGGGQLIHIFEEINKQEFRVEKAIEDLLQIKVSKEAVYPWLVCSTCLEKLREFRLFKIRCAECQFVIHNRVRKGSVPKERDWKTEREKGGIRELTSIKPEIDSNLIPMAITIGEEDANVEDLDNNDANPLEVMDSLQEKEDENLTMDENKYTTLTMDPETSECAAGALVAEDVNANPLLEKSMTTPNDHSMEDGSPGRRLRECTVPMQEFPISKQTKLISQYEENDEKAATEKDTREGVITPRKQTNGDNVINVAKRRTVMTNEDPHSCCKSSTSKDQLKEHTRGTHSGVKFYHCSICNKSFIQEDSFNVHMLTHSDVKPHKCSNCYKSFNDRRTLKKHMIIHSDDRPYKCSICCKSFNDKSTLRSHVKIHSSIKPYKCSNCCKSFSARRTLKKHMLIHSGVKPYKCSICCKSFIDMCGLKKHLFSHSGIKPHKCSICCKSFVRNSNLKQHMLIHSGVKPYNCSICCKSFTDRSTLRKHMFIHSGAKPYKCSHCSKSFSQICNLNTHMLLHSNNRPHKCSICCKTFVRSSHLKQHMLIHSDVTTHIRGMTIKFAD